MVENEFPEGIREQPDEDDRTVAKEPGTDSLPVTDASAEVDEGDYKKGQRRKGGQEVQ